MDRRINQAGPSMHRETPTQRYQRLGMNEHYEMQRRVQAMLSTHYRCLQVPRVFWYDSLHLPLEGTVTEQKIYEVSESPDRKVMLKAIKMQDILEPSANQEQFPRRILLEGWPFSGKTTLIYQMALDWSKECDYLLRFHFFFIINMRYLAYKKRTIEDVLVAEASLHNADPDMTRELLRDRDRSCLIIFDDVEELSPEISQQMIPYLTGEVYKNSTVLVLSRTGEFFPHAGKDKSVSTFSRIKSAFDPMKRFRWDKRVYTRGLNRVHRRAYLEEYIAASQNLQGMYDRLTHAFNKYMEKIYRYPMFLLLMARTVEVSDYAEPKTRTDLYKRFLTDIVRNRDVMVNFKDENEIAIFQMDSKTPYINLLLLFSELCFHKVVNNEVDFTEAELLQSCNNDKNILHMGLLGRELVVSKPAQLVLQPLHFTFIEFFAVYYLWRLFHEGEKKFRAVFQDKVMPLYLNEKSQYKWVLQFLVGLLEDKAGIIFEHVVPKALVYHGEFSLFLDLIEDCQVIDNILKPSMLIFLPTEWWIHWQWMSRKFASSPLHKSLFSFAMQHKHIRTLKWHVGMDVTLPEEINVDRFELTVAMRHLGGLNTLLKVKRIQCRHFVCYYDGQKARVNYDLFMSFASNLIKEKFSLHLNDTDFQQLMTYLIREVKNDRLKSIRLHVTIQEYQEEFITGFCDFLEKETWLDSLALSVWPCNVKEKEFTKLKEGLQKIVEALVKCKNLRELSICGESDIPVVIPLDQLCHGRPSPWEYLQLDSVSVTSSSKNLAANLSVNYLSLEAVVLKKGSYADLIRACSETLTSLVIGSADLLTSLDGKWPLQLDFLHVKLYCIPPTYFKKIGEVLRTTHHVVFEFYLPISVAEEHVSDLVNVLDDGSQITLDTLTLVDPPAEFLTRLAEVLGRGLKSVPSTIHRTLSRSWSFWNTTASGAQGSSQPDESRRFVKTLQISIDLAKMEEIMWKQLRKLLKVKRLERLQISCQRCCFDKEAALLLLDLFPERTFKIAYDYCDIYRPFDDSLHRTLQEPQRFVITITMITINNNTK